MCTHHEGELSVEAIVMASIAAEQVASESYARWRSEDIR